jgi:H+/gluconate symporter-like permease
MWSSKWWMLATERAAKTAAQIILTLGAGNAFNLFTADWAVHHRFRIGWRGPVLRNEHRV